MDNLLSKQTVSISQCVLDCQEECAVSGEFTLPDYCRDMAMVLKCRMTPYIRQRHCHGDKMMLDILVGVRVLYLDEERNAPRAVEFTIPTACTIPTQNQMGMQEMDIRLNEKYVNCRALSPRRIEVRGAVTVSAKAVVCAQREVAVTQTENGLHTRPKTVRYSYPIGMAEKVLSLHECLDFPETMPPAEMLLGGECRAVVKECKLLAGKGIVKGNIYVHQLYAVDTETGECRCLDYVLPFSQIMDINGVDEEMSYRVNVQILSDIERCMTGARGENTMLDIALKLAIQLQVFCSDQTEVFLDAFHTGYPITATKAESRFITHLGCRSENAVLPMQVPLHTQRLSQILDVWVEQRDCQTRCDRCVVNIRGCLCVCVLARGEEGQIVYMEHPEDFCMEFPCTGNHLEATVTTTELRYRVVEEQLELQIGVSVLLDEECVEDILIVQQITAHKDQCYPPQKVGLIAYYAQSGESVWDIAAHCRTVPECICSENGVTEDVLQHAMMLMVPIVS